MTMMKMIMMMMLLLLMMMMLMMMLMKMTKKQCLQRYALWTGWWWRNHPYCTWPAWTSSSSFTTPDISITISISIIISISIAAIISTKLWRSVLQTREKHSRPVLSQGVPEHECSYKNLETQFCMWNVNIWTFEIGEIGDAHCTFLWSVQIYNWSKTDLWCT